MIALERITALRSGRSLKAQLIEEMAPGQSYNYQLEKAILKKEKRRMT